MHSLYMMNIHGRNTHIMWVHTMYVCWMLVYVWIDYTFEPSEAKSFECVKTIAFIKREFRAEHSVENRSLKRVEMSSIIDCSCCGRLNCTMYCCTYRRGKCSLKLLMKRKNEKFIQTSKIWIEKWIFLPMDKKV